MVPQERHQEATSVRFRTLLHFGLWQLEPHPEQTRFYRIHQNIHQPATKIRPTEPSFGLQNRRLFRSDWTTRRSLFKYRLRSALRTRLISLPVTENSQEVKRKEPEPSGTRLRFLYRYGPRRMIQVTTGPAYWDPVKCWKGRNMDLRTLHPPSTLIVENKCMIRSAWRVRGPGLMAPSRTVQTGEDGAVSKATVSKEKKVTDCSAHRSE